MADTKKKKKKSTAAKKPAPNKTGAKKQAPKKAETKKAAVKKQTTNKNTAVKNTAAQKPSSSAKTTAKKPSSSAKTTANKPVASSAKPTAVSTKSTVKKPVSHVGQVSKKKGFFTIKRVIIFALLAACIIFAAVFGNYYYKNVQYYKEHFFEGTYINGTDCSHMTAEEARQTIQDKLNEYSFTFTDHEGRSSTVTAEEIEVTYADDGEVGEILNAQDALKWIFRKDEEESHTVTSGYTYNRDLLMSWIKALPCLNDGIAPMDAFEYQGEDGYWHISPEAYGDEIEPSVIEDLITDSVDNARTEADMEGLDCFIQPTVLADDAALTASVQEKNDAIDAAIARAARIDEITNVELTFNSYIDSVSIGEDLLREMIVDDENGDPIIDKKQVTAWVKNWAEERGFTDNAYLFVTHGGKIVTVRYGVIAGWSLDLDDTAERAYQMITERNSGVLRPVLRDEGGTSLDEETYVEIKIPSQEMWFYLEGEELVDTPIVTGDIIRGYDTPSDGVWYIYYKTTNYTMVGPRMANGQPEYTLFVRYWMPFNDQIGIHDHSGRGDSFGGEIYQGNGSHGCVNTPLENVEVIYENAPIGTPVVIYS